MALLLMLAMCDASVVSRVGRVALIFADADITPVKSPQDRNAEMAALLGDLIGADDERTSELLRKATPMLLAPFRSIPEAGSVYGGIGSSLAEKLEAYETAISERSAKARAAGSEARAVDGEHTNLPGKGWWEGKCVYRERN